MVWCDCPSKYEAAGVCYTFGRCCQYIGYHPANPTATGNSRLNPLMQPVSDRHTQVEIPDDLQLAERAAQGDHESRGLVSQLADPLIRYQTKHLCRKFCQGNFSHYRCTLDVKWEHQNSEAPFCEWGNASYGWMLEDLTGPKRLRRYQGKNGASLKDYLFQIANSLPFYERWKDWRFARRINVPTYVQALHEKANKVFYAMVSGDTPAMIAQKVGLAETEVLHLSREIITQLHQRNRLHLLNPPQTVSLSQSWDESSEENQETDIPVAPPDLGQLQMNEKLWQAWDQLNAVEQFVLEAMLIDEQDANDVLAALEKLGLSLEEGKPAATADRQKLYYFRRKTLARLLKLMEL